MVVWRLGHRARWHRLRSGVHKLRWGAATVGISATVRGLFRYAWLRLRRPETIEVTLRSGGSLIADVPGQVVPTLIIFGDPIDPEYPFLRRIARADWVVVDVGAAIGQFTVFGARLGVHVVHACEPSDANLVALRRNLERNDVSDHVVVHRLALSNTTGESVFATAPTTYLSRLDLVDRASPHALDGAPVPVRPLSDATTAWRVDHINVLKVNVAGFEPEVLSGADALFEAGDVDIMIALVGAGSLPCYVRMAGLGYRFFFFHPREVTLYEMHRFDDRFLAWRPSPARHVIAVHSQAIADGVLGTIPIVQAPV